MFYCLGFLVPYVTHAPPGPSPTTVAPVSLERRPVLTMLASLTAVMVMVVVVGLGAGAGAGADAGAGDVDRGWYKDGVGGGVRDGSDVSDRDETEPSSSATLAMVPVACTATPAR